MVYLANSKQDMLIKKRGKFLDETTQPIMLHVATNNAYFGKDRKRNDCPYMMISGVVYGVSFYLDGRDEQLIQPSFPFTVRYEFGDSEHEVLVNKGYWRVPLFKCPEIISNNPDYQQPITQTPVKIRRYEVNGEIMITVELEDMDKVYITNEQESGYRLSDYVEYQTAQPEVNETMKQKESETYISTYDDNLADEIAAMFANRNAEENLQSDEELDKRVAQEKNKQAEISAEMHKLTASLPTVQKEKARAKAHDEQKGKKEATTKPTVDNPSLPPEEIIHTDFGGDAELAAFVGESLKSKNKAEESVIENVPNAAEQSPEQDLNKLFEEFEQETQLTPVEPDAPTKEDVEAELQSATTVKSNKNLGKLTTPEDDIDKLLDGDSYNI